MHVAGNALRPGIVIPGGEHIQFIPAIAGEGSGAVAVILQQKLTAKDIDMVHDLRVAGLVGNVESEVF